MRSLKQNKTSPLSKIIFVLIFLLACWARAEEAPPAAEGASAVKAEDTAAAEYREEEGSSQKLKGEIEKSKHEIEELFVAKSKATTTADVLSITGEITAKSAELKKNYEDYRKLQLHLRFKHPAKGDASERKYEREEAFEPDENHFDLSLQGKLDRVKSNFAAHYSVERKKPIAMKDIETESERKPAAVEDSKRIVLAK